MLNKTVVIDIVGLCSRLIGPNTPFLQKRVAQGHLQAIKPAFPAVTTTAQYTYLTGKYPTDHGIVGNGWYFKDECEVKFWRQSNHLVQAPKIWEIMKAQDSKFTCANMFWWYNMYSSVDYSVTPRPQYAANGLKFPDVYSHPSYLRDELQSELGAFPLFKFWGPATSIVSSKWIADASMRVEEKYNPTLTLIYLPHMDYGLQKYDHTDDRVLKDLEEIDGVVEELVEFYEKRGAQVLLLSEYGITPVQRPIYINRVLREAGLIQVRVERGGELLDAGASEAFAAVDHQIAHVYVKDKSRMTEVRDLLEKIEGVEHVLGLEGKKEWNISHDRAGDLVLVADKDSWFAYYYWLDDSRAPDFARIVDIHKKPGYDPVEMFVNPKIAVPMAKIGATLLKKKLGFRYLMDVIPLDATLIRGSHGRIPENTHDWPILLTSQPVQTVNETPTQVFDVLVNTLQST
ncbi:MAG: nucleotide pyrophosphatase/phosphodiesterase family protein [Bacteroidota bacterium]